LIFNQKQACLFFDQVPNYWKFLQRRGSGGIEIHRVIHSYCGQRLEALIEEGLTPQCLLSPDAPVTLRALFGDALIAWPPVRNSDRQRILHKH
jgi:hypothetical protein